MEKTTVNKLARVENPGSGMLLAEQLEELARKAEKAAAAAGEPLAGRLEELARKVKKAAAVAALIP